MATSARTRHTAHFAGRRTVPRRSEGAAPAPWPSARARRVNQSPAHSPTCPPPRKVGAALLSLLLENSPVPDVAAKRGKSAPDVPAFAYTYRRLEGSLKDQAFVEATPALVGNCGWMGGCA